ncbi:MAG: NUDIX domain-containing protein [Erysipelotrichaceae bacterium]|nr:NUDIX domain-containing protein [Erysipelotrichaceae bacterium]
MPMTKQLLESIPNLRDLASYPCAYGEMTKGLIYRSSSPYFASDEDLKRLKEEIGIRSVLDLRGEISNQRNPSPFINDPEVYWRLFNIPKGEVIPTDGDDIPSWYMSFIAEPTAMRPIFREILNAPKPLLFHCEAGKDRTGTVALILELLNGVSKEDVCRDYNLSFDGRLDVVEKRTKSFYPELPEFFFHPPVDAIARFVDAFLERYGDARQYLEAMGLSDSEIDALANIFGVQEVSAGAVVFHKDYVLVEHMKLGHYSMPKGHVEESDGGLTETARREILEETGLEVDFMPGFEKVTVYSPKPGHIKRVHWFVAEARSKEAKPQPEEVSEIYFLSPADALRVLSHDDDRRVCSDACFFYFDE